MALRRAFARDFGWAWGKKIAIGTPKNAANLSKSEMDGLKGAVSQGEIVLAVAFTAGGFVLDRAAARPAAQDPTPSPHCQRNDRETVQPLGRGDAE